MTSETNDPILTAFQESLQKKLEGAFLINGVHALLPTCSELEIYDHASGDTFYARVYATRDEHREAVRAAWATHCEQLPSIDLPHYCKSLGLVEAGGHFTHLARFQPGMTLADYLSRIGRMVPTVAIRLTVQLLHLLEKLRRKGMHHSHLTPRDIVLGSDGTPYIKNHGLWHFEYEIAKQLGVENLIDPAYLSPEHLQQQPIDTPAEVYSVACLLHEMLVGQTPFHGNYDQVREDQLKKPLVNPQTLNRDINLGLARVIVKALAKNPAERFTEYADFAQTLAMLLPTAESARYQQESGQTQQPSASEKEDLNNQLIEAANQAKGGDLEGAMHSVAAVLRISQGYAPAIELAEKIYRALHQTNIKQHLAQAQQCIAHEQQDEALGELHQLLALDPRNQEARQLQSQLLEALQREKIDLHRFVPVQVFMERAAVAKTLEQMPLAELLWTQVLYASPTADSSYLELMNTQKRLASKELNALYGEHRMPVQQDGKPGGNFGDDELEQLFAPLSQAASDRAAQEQSAPEQQQSDAAHPNVIDPDAYDTDMTVAEAEPIPAPPIEEGPSAPEVPESIEDSFEAELAGMEEDFDEEDLDDGPSHDFKTNEVDPAQMIAEEAPDPLATRPLSDIETVPTEPPHFPENRENLATQRVDYSTVDIGYEVESAAEPAEVPPLQPEVAPEENNRPAPPPVAEPAPESKVVAETRTQVPSKPAKSKTSLFVALGAVAAVLLVVVGVMLYNTSVRKAEYEKAARTSYQTASTLESSGELEEALKAWENMQSQFPGFSDVNERQTQLEQRILERRNTLDRYLGRARELISEGTLLGNGNENAASYLKMITEIDAENSKAQAMLSEIGESQMTLARELFDKGDAKAARQVYADLLQVSVSFKNDMFEAEVDSYIEAKVVGPKLERLDRLIKAQKWDDAVELSEDLRDEMANTRLLDDRWDEVANTTLTKLQDAEQKNRKKEMMQHLEVLALIRPDDPAGYATRYNSMSRELNQAAIDRLEKQVRGELKKKDYVRAGRFAYQLSKLDSENKLAESTLQEVRSAFRSKIKDQKQGSPKAAITTYDQLIQVYNWRSYRRERQVLQDRVNGFESLLSQLNKQADAPYASQISTLVKIQEQYNDFFDDPAYRKLADTKKLLETEQQRLQSLKSYVDKAKDDNAVQYSEIVAKLKAAPAFQRNIGKQYVASTLKEYQNKVSNYTGPVTLIIRRGKDLPRATSGFNKDPEAYAVLKVGDKTFRTGVQRNERNPVWDYTCSFDAKPNQKLSFSVYNDKGDGELLGTASLDSVPESGKGIEVKGKDGWSLFLDVRRKR